MNTKTIHSTLLLLLLLILASCGEEESLLGITEEESTVVSESTVDIPDWTEDTHSKSADPNFEEVFEDNAVKRLDFVISEDNWDLMLQDMTNLYGAFGSRSSDGFASDDPVFVSGSVFYTGIEWYKVGFRFKGNSSLASSWRAGIQKLSFKLDFLMSLRMSFLKSITSDFMDLKS